MTQSVCAECGEASPSGVQFCPACGHFMWSAAAPAAAPPAVDPPAERPADVLPAAAASPDPAATAVIGKRVPATPPNDDPTTITPLRKQTALPPKVTVPDGDVVLEGARRGSVELQLTNPSSIVEGYRVELVAPPPWLTVAVPETRLLPGDRAAVRVGFEVRPGALVVAQRVRLRLRLRPESDQRVHTDAEVALVVPRVGGPARIRTEPAVVRVKDAVHGRFTVHLDNRGSNHPRRYAMSGTDDEGVVRFTFDPEVVEAPPDGSTAVYVQVTAPPPAAGERSERNLAVRANADAADDGLGAVVRLIQETSAAAVEVPVRLRLEPSSLRTADSDLAELHVVVDNRAGHRDRRVWLTGNDPERQIGFVFRTAELWVAPGTERATLLQLRAPVPPPGEQTDRTFTVTATDGRLEIEAAGHWAQRSGTAPIATAAIQLDPEVVRLRDRAEAQLAVVVDNQRGSRPLRVRLSGDDPENAVRFAFRPPVLDVAPGTSAWAEIRMAAPHPPHGEETVRAIRVRASDENGAVEATGALHQYSSPTAISTARLSLEPQRVVARGSGTGRLRVHLDNRAGAFPLSAHLHGTDPEQAVRFVFHPAALEVAPGQVGVADVRVSAPRPESGETATRPFTIIADDGRGVVEAAGSLVQSAGDRRPVWRVVLTVLGTLLVAVGCFRDWLSGDPNSLLPNATTIPASIGDAAGAGAPGSAREAADLLRTLQPVERTLTLLLAAVMAFGLTGPRGRLTRTTGMVVALTMVAAALFWRFTGLSLADGAILVAVGGAVGFLGGLCVRR